MQSYGNWGRVRLLSSDWPRKTNRFVTAKIWAKLDLSREAKRSSHRFRGLPFLRQAQPLPSALKLGGGGGSHVGPPVISLSECLDFGDLVGQRSFTWDVHLSRPSTTDNWPSWEKLQPPKCVNFQTK